MKKHSDYKMMIASVVTELNNFKEYSWLHHNSPEMPSIEKVDQIMLLLKKTIFPGFFGHSNVSGDLLNYFLGADIDNIYRMLSEQIKRGFCFDCSDDSKNCAGCEVKAVDLASKFILQLPKIKRNLATDVVAAYNGDPAAMNYAQTIFCYPSILSLTYHRIAHELLKLGVPLLPRIISEMAHSKTGIDIHPGASIGEYFFIDHGTGVVIGETAIIGNNVRLYQGVTLGAVSFPLDENKKPIKGIVRHPIVENDVIIYSNSTLLGRITIGKGAVIGANMWITHDVPPGAKEMKENKTK